MYVNFILMREMLERKYTRKKCITMVILVVFRPSNCRTHFSCICMFENFPFRIRKSKCDVNFKIKIYPEGLVLQQAQNPHHSWLNVLLAGTKVRIQR